MASRDQIGGWRRRGGPSWYSGAGSRLGRKRASTGGRGNQEAGKKKIMKVADWSTEKRVSVRGEDIWDLQKSQMEKKAACARPTDARREANDKV